MEQWMWIIWLVVFVVALAIEAIGTDLVSIWFAAGAIVAIILSLIPEVPWWVEVIVFFVISVATLCCLRPLVHRYMRRDLVNSNIDEMKGQKGLLIEKIDMLHRGVVKINDVKWTAIGAEERDVIKEGTTVVVLAVSGNKLIVKAVDNSTEEEK
jgi:membrane protein implicated in regulation of membrane protease activity